VSDICRLQTAEFLTSVVFPFSQSIGPLYWSNWNLERWFLWRGEKLKNPEKNTQIKVRTNNKLNPRMAPEASALTTTPSLHLWAD